MKSKLTTRLELGVSISYQILDPLIVDGEVLPAQVDITEVIVEIPDQKGKPRQVNLLRALDESTILLLEDEVLDSLFP